MCVNSQMNHFISIIFVHINFFPCNVSRILINRNMVYDCGFICMEIIQQLITTKMIIIIIILPLLCLNLLDNNSSTVVTSITSTSKKPPETQNAIIKTFVSTTAVDRIDGDGV